MEGMDRDNDSPKEGVVDMAASHPYIEDKVVHMALSQVRKVEGPWMGVDLADLEDPGDEYDKGSH